MPGLPSVEIVSVDVSGRAMRFARAGEGTPVVLLHGIGRSLEDWTDVHARLARHHTVYAVDLPGFGGSVAPPGRSTLPGLGLGVIRLLDKIGETRPIRLVGNSLGGAVALQIAVASPERVAALVLVNSAGFGREVAAGFRVLAVPGLGRVLLTPNRRGIARAQRNIFFDKTFATPERIERAFRLASRPGARAAFLNAARSLGGWRGVHEPWRRELLAGVNRVALPTLVMWGSDDAIFPAHHLDAARAALPHGRFHLFADTGHMPQIERPAEFVRVVEGFLGDADGRGAP